MRNKIVRLLMINCCLLFTLYPISFAEEELTLDETRALLQKGLTIYEIDQEVLRLTEKESDTAKEIIKVEQEIVEQSELVSKTKERAGQILRSYYMGERDSLIMLVLSMNNLSEALAVIEFINIVLKSDKSILDDYLTEYNELNELHESLVITQTSLQEIKQEFLNQRETLVQLQAELDAELALNAEAEKLTQLIHELTLEWENVGLPIFRNYLSAFAIAIKQLPEIQTLHKDVISVEGTKIQFQMTDAQLNEFLIYKNELFQNFAFKFDEEHVEISGKQDDIEALITGYFNLETEPENVIRFHLDELVFNGYTLPETTIAALEEEFAFGLYPEDISILGFNLEATELQMESGQLLISLKFKK